MKTPPLALRNAPPFALRHLTLGLLGLACTALANAQQADVPASDAQPGTTLPAVRVRSTTEAETAGGPVRGYVAQRSATATKSDTPINEVAQAISVIPRDQIVDQGVSAVQDALRYSAGVTTGIYGARNTTEYFVIRGSKATVLLNGLRQGQTWFAEPLDELYGYERVEVLRGPSSIVAGQSGPGGLVNLVSKRPQAAAHREINVELGTEQRKQVSADFTGAVDETGTLLYRVVGLGLDTNTQVDHADFQRVFFAPSLTWKPRAGTKLTVYGEYQRDNYGNNDAFLPTVGTLTPGPHGTIPINRFISEPGWDGNTGTRSRLGYEFEQDLGSGWTLRNDLRHDDSKRELKSMYSAWWLGFLDGTGTPDPVNGRYLGRAWAIDEGRTLTTAGDLLLEGKFQTGAVAHTLVTGVDLLRYRRTDSYIEGDAGLIDVYTPTYGTFQPPATLDEAAASHSQPKVQQLGFLVLDRIRVGRWALTAGLRYDDAKTESAGTTQKVDAWTKNLGAVYLAEGGWSPYASYSESFEAQGADLTGRVFEPKRGQQVEAGVKWSPERQNVRATAAVFHLQEKNRLKGDPANPLNQIESAPITTKGLELEAAANLGAWDFTAAYTRLSARDDETDKHVAFVPENAASAWVLHKFDPYGVRGLKAGLGVRYQGKTSDGTDTVWVPSVTLADAMVSYDTGDWRVGLNVSNIADKSYVASCDSSGYCWYGEKRKVVATATYRF